MTAVHVRRRRTAALVAGSGAAGLGGLLALVALIAGGSSDEPVRAPTPARPAATKPVPGPPPDPLAPRSIRSTGTLVTVPPEGPPSGDPAGIGFAVEVERGVEIDRGAFARAVEGTLLDRRGWTGDGAYSLRRAGGEEAGFRVTLASPDTTDRLCAPLQTNGTYSCHQSGRAVLNAERWARGAEAYGRDLPAYRRYMVNHEVGHALGQGHADCPGEGQRAPVMMQQTKGVGLCAPNPWPLASER